MILAALITSALLIMLVQMGVTNPIILALLGALFMFTYYEDKDDHNEP